MSDSSIQGLRKLSRENRSRVECMRKRDPDLWTKLRQGHNSVLRQWSYMGTTSVPRRRGSSLRVISRSSQDSADLPPLFHKVPDLRETQSCNRSVSKNLKWMIAALSPRSDPNPSEATPERHIDGSFNITRILEKISLNRNSPPESPHPDTVPQDAHVSHETEAEREIPLDAMTGITFCEELLRFSKGDTGLETTFRLLNVDSDGQVSLEGFIDFTTRLKLDFKTIEVTSIYQFLRKTQPGSSPDCSPCHFSKRTEILIRKYRKHGRCFMPYSETEELDPAERYFITHSFPRLS